jgi:hypothetical protein
MMDMFKEKENLINDLSDQYSRSLISLEEYEKMIDHVNKIDSVKELKAVQKMTRDNSDLTVPENNEEQVTVFSWRSTNAKPVNGNAGKFVCVFGTNQIKIEDLPAGKTVLHVESIFGLTEILVSKKVKVINKAVPVMSGVFAPNDTEAGDSSDKPDRPELYITGTAVFGNITIIRTD